MPLAVLRQARTRDSIDADILPVKSLRTGQGRFDPGTLNHSLYRIELLIGWEPQRTSEEVRWDAQLS